MYRIEETAGQRHLRKLTPDPDRLRRRAPGATSGAMRIALPFALLIAAGPALAADRSVAVTNFDRVRIDGPFSVTLTTRASPNARVSGDPRVLENVTVSFDGGILIIRRNAAAADRAPKNAPAPTITLSTRDLRSASVIGGGQLTVTGPVAAQRVDLTVTGAGVIEAPEIATDQLIATLIGTGEMKLGGTARSARLLSNGTGAIAAEGLVANEAVVRTDGPTAITVTARFTATASSTGLGPITILGKPDCKVRAVAGGPITCHDPKKF